MPSLPAVMLLDFDGVINADRPPWPDPDKRVTADLDGQPRDFRWSPMMVDHLVHFHDKGQVEIRWCSTWAPWAAQLSTLLGVPEFPGCWDSEPPSVTRAKREAAQAVLHAGRRLIWIDDEAIPLARQRRELGMTGDALYLRPNGFKGISKGNIGQIRAFLSQAAQ